MRLAVSLLTSSLAALIALGALLFGCAPAHAASADDAVIARGRQFCAQFYADKIDAVWAQLVPEAQKALPQPELTQFRAQVEHDGGAEQKVIGEEVKRAGGTVVYVRHARFQKLPQPFDFSVAFVGDRVGGFQIVPAGPEKEAPSTKLDYHDKAELRVPFEGAWTVVWGGRTVAQNQHAANREQRFAYDLLIAVKDSTHRGDGTKNSDYYCYGKSIFAPAAGHVVLVRDGIAENVPGQMNRAERAGNHVVIDHGNGEFSFLAHFIPGSITVKVGQAVAAGQLIGRCGNSGNSSEPHLHFHLQTTANLDDGDGLPAQLHDYVADGKPVSVGEPVQGQVIARK